MSATTAEPDTISDAAYPFGTPVISQDDADGMESVNVATVTCPPRALATDPPKSTRTAPEIAAYKNHGAPFVATRDSDSGTPIVGDFAVKFENFPPPENATPSPRSLPPKSTAAPEAAL